MVKNTHGGSGTKGLARKHQRQHDIRLILPSNELEVIVCVTKMYGNGMCQVFDNENNEYIAHIRNKFRGKQKRHNMISASTIVMVGLRDWEKPYKNCDIMEIYSDDQVSQIKQNPSISINNVIAIRNNTLHASSSADEDAFEFSNEIVEEDDENLKESSMCMEEFTIKHTDEIDIDDI